MKIWIWNRSTTRFKLNGALGFGCCYVIHVWVSNVEERDLKEELSINRELQRKKETIR